MAVFVSRNESSDRLLASDTNNGVRSVANIRRQWSPQDLQGNNQLTKETHDPSDCKLDCGAEAKHWAFDSGGSTRVGHPQKRR